LKFGKVFACGDERVPKKEQKTWQRGMAENWVEEWEEEWAEQGKTFPYLLALFGFLEAVRAVAKGAEGCGSLDPAHVTLWVGGSWRTVDGGLEW